MIEKAADGRCLQRQIIEKAADGRCLQCQIFGKAANDRYLLRQLSEEVSGAELRSDFGYFRGKG